MVVGRLLSYWEGNFSGAMLNFGGGSILFITYPPSFPESQKLLDIEEQHRPHLAKL